MRLDDWPIGPGQRLELAIRIPDKESERVVIQNVGSSRPYVVAELTATGPFSWSRPCGIKTITIESRP